MKIYCEKCHNDITKDVSKLMEGYEVGQISCPNCGKKQSRYLSESDVILYLLISEAIYLLISFLTILFINAYGLNIYIIIGFAVCLIIGFLITKKTMSFIYLDGFLKKDFKTKIFKENVQQIKRSQTWQSLLFFAIAITAITGDTLQGYFLFLSFGILVINFIKYILCVKKERNE